MSRGMRQRLAGAAAVSLVLLMLAPATAEAAWRSLPAPGTGIGAVSAVGRWDAWATAGSSLMRYRAGGWRVGRAFSRAALNDIDLDRRTDGWAVGSRGSGAFALHRTGSRWQPVRPPQPITGRSALLGVDAFSPSEAWAVGQTGTRTLAEHWDGTGWSIVPSNIIPDYSDGFDDFFLRDVAVTANGRAWAVGDERAYHIDRALLLRWNGSRWARIPVSPASGSSGHCTARPLFTLAPVSNANVWAFGGCTDPFDDTCTAEATALHVVRGAPTWVTLPAVDNVQAVSGSSVIPGSSKVWAVGSGRSVDPSCESSTGPYSLALLGP
jgi:hypothetical protein